MTHEEFYTKAKKYMFFYENDQEECKKRYSKIESMILQEFQALNPHFDGLRMTFVDILDLRSVDNAVEGLYRPEIRACAFFPKHFDFAWEMMQDEIKKCYPGCNSLREYIRLQVRHEYRHFQQFKFVESKGLDPLEFRDFYIKEYDKTYKINPLEIDARNFGTGNATDGDLYRILDDYMMQHKK